MEKIKADDQYKEREKLIRGAYDEALDKNIASSLRLDSLVAAMKALSAQKPFLSSMYFAGAKGDHPFFLHNDKVAIGISVLPEDAAKAGLIKSHPHQTEVIIVLSGKLYLEVVKDQQLKKVQLSADDVFVINKGECHRILPVENQSATFLFVKTNPAREPKSEKCELKSFL